VITLENNRDILQKAGFNITEEQLKKFHIYYETLIEWNKKVNLTNIVRKEDVYVKHFLDSLMIGKSIDLDSQTLLDVGSGAGFPSVPLKIVFPELKVTIVDGLKKRINFLEHLAQNLDLNIELIHSRAEDYDKKNTFDIVTARAVAPLNKLLELTIPFVKTKGCFLALKGDRYQEELSHAEHAMSELKTSVTRIDTFSLMGDSRAIIVFDKYANSDIKYPRTPKHIKKKPL